MTTIKKTTKTKDHYEKECPKCGKVVNGVSVKQVNHNMKIHKIFCKEKKIEEKQ